MAYAGTGRGLHHVDVVTFTDYTGRAASRCDGTGLNDELVIEYERKSTVGQWTVKARRASEEP